MLNIFHHFTVSICFVASVAKEVFAYGDAAFS